MFKIHYHGLNEYRVIDGTNNLLSTKRIARKIYNSTEYYHNGISLIIKNGNNDIISVLDNYDEKWFNLN